MIRKLLLFLFLLACLPGGVYARIVFADLQYSKLVEWGAPRHNDVDGQHYEITTKNGVSYTYTVPGNNTEISTGNDGKWYGFSLWEIPISDLKFDATLDEDITVVYACRSAMATAMSAWLLEINRRSIRLKAR